MNEARKPARAGGTDEETRRNIRVLMTKNFLLKQRMWQKLVFGCFPAMLFMELIVPPLMLIGLTLVKMEAPLYMKTTGYGGWPVCNENEKHPCTETTPIECVAGDVGHVDVASAASRAGVASATTAEAGEITTISTCESNSKYVFQPDPFFYTIVALHWARDGGPKLALTADKPEDIVKVRRFQQWVSEHWYPEQYMSEIPCADLELRDKRTEWEIRDTREQLVEAGAYVMCAEEELERFSTKYATCWCDGRVKMGTAGDPARDRGEYWTPWRNNTGYIECSVDVFGNPNPDRDPYEDDEYYVCLCDPSPEPVVRDEGEWTNEGCTMSKCRDNGNDCCAPQAFREVARCADGYLPHWVAPCAGMQGDGRYTCCPPPAGAGGPGACHFQDDTSGTLSSFSDVTHVYESRAAMEKHMKSPEYGANNPWGYDILGAISFSKIPGDGSPGTAGDWEYSLMVNDSAIWGVFWKRNVSRGWKLYEDLDEFSIRYDQSRFLTLQALVDRYIIHQRNNDPSFDIERGLDAMFATNNRVGKRSWPDENGWNRDAVNQTYLMEPQMWIPQYVQFAALPIM